MTDRLSFRQKILLLPAVATLSLLILLALTSSFGKANQALLVNIESGFAPARSLSRDLQEELANLQRALQDAVASEDPLEGLARDRQMAEARGVHAMVKREVMKLQHADLAGRRTA